MALIYAAIQKGLKKLREKEAAKEFDQQPNSTFASDPTTMASGGNQQAYPDGGQMRSSGGDDSKTGGHSLFGKGARRNRRTWLRRRGKGWRTNYGGATSTLGYIEKYSL